MVDLIAFLRRTELLAHVPESGRQTISADLKDVRVEAGDFIFRDGDEGDAVYFIVQGTIRIEKDGIRLVSLHPPECVGEFALIDEGPRSASAIAETDAQLLKWKRKDFVRGVAQNHEMIQGILKNLTRKLRKDISLQVQAGLERERWLQDLKRAHEIQMAMLPHDDLYTERMRVFGQCNPAADVGGDYFDYLPLEDDKLGLIVADVMGHGFFSGLLVPMAKSCLHTQATIDYSPPSVMQSMNRTVSFSVESGLLMTCCYILIDSAGASLTYCNAGHPHPYHYRRSTDSLEKLGSTDMILGVPGFEEAPFSMSEGSWETGDLLVLYSDGITEATNRDDEEFGEERLEQIILENKDELPALVKGNILEALAGHCEGLPQNDDITVVVAKAV
jgi:serine phosphatase RsbU (regulator of sigma subunit)